MLIVGFTLWYVWKAHCLKVFQELVQPLEELIMDIWFAIINFLRGQLNEVYGHYPVKLLAKMEEDVDGDARRKWPEVELPSPC